MRRDADDELGGFVRLEDGLGPGQDDERGVVGIVRADDPNPKRPVVADVADAQPELGRFTVDGFDRRGDGVQLQSRRS